MNNHCYGKAGLSKAVNYREIEMRLNSSINKDSDAEGDQPPFCNFFFFSTRRKQLHLMETTMFEEIVQDETFDMVAWEDYCKGEPEIEIQDYFD